MAKGIVEHIVDDIRNLGTQIILVQDSVGFLQRKDVTKILSGHNINVVEKNKLKLRILFELRKTEYSNKILIFLCDEFSGLPEDIVNISSLLDFHLSEYFGGYHVPSLIPCQIEILDKLYQQKQLVQRSKKETQNLINTIKKEKRINTFDTEAFRGTTKNMLENTPDWHKIINFVSQALVDAIDTNNLNDVIAVVNQVNTAFQQNLKAHYKQLNSSNPIKKPKIVSKILDHLNANAKQDKTALIVIDGMSYWQYLLLNNHFPDSFHVKNDIIYSWIPSITQLSRQAIFKGDSPDYNYIQNPKNEEKLWKNYWKDKGLNDYEIRYDYENVNFDGLERINKLAVVFKDLDDKMHSSTDYKDLKGLTANWVTRSQIINTIQTLLNKNFVVYITTDHGNIFSKGWRNLSGREKLGTNKSGSRSQRHLEYSDSHLADEFLETNEELKEYVAKENNVIYFTNEYSFSTKKTLITHGGSHLLEVLIPFIKIEYEH